MTKIVKKSKRALCTMWWDESPDWFWAKLPLRGGVVVVTFAFNAREALALAKHPKALALYLRSHAHAGENTSPELASAAAFAFPLLYRVSRSALFRVNASSRQLRTVVAERSSPVDIIIEPSDAPALTLDPQLDLPLTEDLLERLSGLPFAHADDNGDDNASPSSAPSPLRIEFRSRVPHGNNPFGSQGKPATSFVNECGEVLSLAPGSAPQSSSSRVAEEWLRQQGYWDMAVRQAAGTHNLNVPFKGLEDACGKRLGPNTLRRFVADVHKAQGIGG